MELDRRGEASGIRAQPLHDSALLLLGAGLRIGELLALKWPDVYSQPAANARFGYIRVPKRKSKNAPRNLTWAHESAPCSKGSRR